MVWHIAGKKEKKNCLLCLKSLMSNEGEPAMRDTGCKIEASELKQVITVALRGAARLLSHPSVFIIRHHRRCFTFKINLMFV